MLRAGGASLCGLTCGALEPPPTPAARPPTRVTTPSSFIFSLMLGSKKKVWMMGAGSARPTHFQTKNW